MCAAARRTTRRKRLLVAAERNRHACPNTHTDSNPDADQHAVFYSNGNSHADEYFDLYTCSDQHADSDPDGDPYPNADKHPDEDSHTNAGGYDATPHNCDIGWDAGIEWLVCISGTGKSQRVRSRESIKRRRVDSAGWHNLYQPQDVFQPGHDRLHLLLAG